MKNFIPLRPFDIDCIGKIYARIIGIRICLICSLLLVWGQCEVQAQTYANFSPQYKDNYSGVNDWITGVTVNGPTPLSFSGGTADGSGSTPTTGQFSNVGTPVGGTIYAGSVVQGQTYTITVSKTANGTYDNYAFAYIDYNDNGTFTDAGEQIMGSGSSSTTQGVHITGGSSTTATASFTVSLSQTPGTYRLRCVMVCGNLTCGGNYTGPSGTFSSLWGDAKDFNITVFAATPCSGSPPSTTVSASPTSVCPATTSAPAGSVLSLAGLGTSGGYTYQWQSSATSGSGYSNASGTSTNAGYTTPTTLPSTPTYYECVITCSNSGLSTASSPVTVNYNSTLNCYCIPSGFTTGASATDNISAVSLTNSPSGALSPTPFSVSGLTAPGSSPWYVLNTTVYGNLILSSTYILTVTKGTNVASIVNAWMDFNQDGVFNTTAVASGGEYIGQSTAANGAYAFTFTVPAGATAGGTTVLRIIEDRTTGTTNPCADGTVRGETRDFYVSIVGAPCSGTPTAGTVSSVTTSTTSVSVCPGSTTVLNVTGNTTGVSGITYQWQSSTSSGGTYSNVSGGSGATTSSYTIPAAVNGTTSATNTYYKCLIGCTASGLSATQTTPVDVTINPTPAITVNGSNTYSTSICNTGIPNSVSLTAANSASGTTTYAWSPSGSLSASSGATVTATPSATTTYTVTGTANTCTATATAAITVNPNAIVVTPSNTSITAGGSTSITASTTSTNGTITYEWTPCSTLSPSTGATVTATPTANTTYTVWAFDPAGCSISSSATVNVIDPVITGTQPTTVAAYYALTSTSNPTYTPFSSGYTNLATGAGVGGTMDDGVFTSVPLGFSFTFNGVAYTSIGVSTNGFIWFGSGTASATEYTPISDASANLSGSGTIAGVISVFGANIYGGATSIAQRLSYGNPTSSTFMVEWYGVKATGSGTNNTNRCDLQILLNQTTGTVDIRVNDYQYGFSSGYTGQVGLRGASNADYLNVEALCGGGTGTWLSPITTGLPNTALCSQSATTGCYPGATSGACVDYTYTPTCATRTLITASGTTNLCPSGTVNLTATTGTSYQWYLNETPIAGPTGTAQTLSSVSTAGNYVAITTSASGCAIPSYITSVTNNANVTPAVSIASSPSPPCGAISATFTTTSTNGGCIPAYKWYYNGTAVTGISSMSSTYTNSALSINDQVYVTMTSDALCTTTNPATSVTITNSTCGPIVYSITGGPYCGTGTITLSNSQTGATYQLMNGSIPIGASQSGTTGSPLTFTPPTNTTGANIIYTVVGTLVTSIAMSGSVTVYSQPSVNISGTTAFCVGSTINLSANESNGTANFNYSWSGPASWTAMDNNESSTTDNQQITGATSAMGGAYSITVTDANSCSASASAIITLITSGGIALASSSVSAIEVSCTDGSGWTYYADPSNLNNWVFAIYKNGNTFTANVNLFVKTASPTQYDSVINTPAKKALYTMGRYWNATLQTGSINGSSNPVNVRFYYDPNDLTQMNTMATARATAFGLGTSQVNGVEWFKTNTGITYTPANNTYSDVPNKLNASSFTTTSGTTSGISYVEYDGLQGFSGGGGDIRVSPGGYALPVELIYVTATPIENDYVRLDWATASEINNSGFYIERSLNGIDFESISFVQGHGNSTVEYKYLFNDANVFANAVYYYRLKQVDVDGNFEYSPIVSAMLISPQGFILDELKPNPASDQVVVNVVIADAQSSIVYLTDMLGRMILSKGWELSPGLNGTQLDISDLAAGTYTVTVRSATNSLSKRLVVTK